MRGMKMPGHLGQVRRTAQNLLVVQVREEENVILIRGAIPGSNGDYVVIREAKKRPKGWLPHAQRPENIKKSEGKKKK
jgi:large subunit ribosomal protein L3